MNRRDAEKSTLPAGVNRVSVFLGAIHGDDAGWNQTATGNEVFGQFLEVGVPITAESTRQRVRSAARCDFAYRDLHAALDQTVHAATASRMNINLRHFLRFRIHE